MPMESTSRKAPGTEVHASDPQKFEGSAVESHARQVKDVREGDLLLDVGLDVVKQRAVQLAAPAEAQLVDVVAQAQQLAGQMLVHGAHLRLVTATTTTTTFSRKWPLWLEIVVDGEGVKALYIFSVAFVRIG